MAVISTSEAVMLARSVGLTGEAVVTAVAIAKAESGLDQSAVGDRSLVDATWGPSIGLWQIRSLKADKGTGRARDADQLAKPAFNARAMYQISNGGRNWSPWSVYTNGSYRQHLNAVRTVAASVAPMPKGGYPGVGGSSGLDAPGRGEGPGGRGAGGRGGGARQVGWIDLPGPDALYGLGGLANGLLGSKADDLVDDTVTAIRGAVLSAVIWSTALGLGVSLILIGTWATVRKAAP